MWKIWQYDFSRSERKIDKDYEKENNHWKTSKRKETPLWILTKQTRWFSSCVQFLVLKILIWERYSSVELVFPGFGNMVLAKDWHGFAGPYAGDSKSFPTTFVTHAMVFPNLQAGLKTAKNIGWTLPAKVSFICNLLFYWTICICNV